MYAIGEKVVYGTNGVFEITDIREETVLGESHEYYILKRLLSLGDSLVYVPCDNERLVEQIRYPLERAAAESLFDEIPAIAPAECCRDSRKRSESYRALIESGDARQMISVIKSVVNNAQLRKSEGKKGYVSDENTLRRAESVLYSELAIALGVKESEVADRVRAAVGLRDGKM